MHDLNGVNTLNLDAPW